MSPDPHSPVPTWQQRQDRKNIGRVEEVKLDGKVVGYILYGTGCGDGGSGGRDPGDGFQPFPVPQCDDPGDGWPVAVVLVLLIVAFVALVTHPIWRG